MTTPNIINSDMYKLHIDLNTDLDPSGSIIYYVLNNSSDDNINCIFNLFLSTLETGKTVTVTLDQYDNDIIRVTENFTLTSSSSNVQKTINLYTQLLKITLSTNAVFDGHIFGNIKKSQVTTIATTSSSTSINVSFDKMNYDAFGRLRVSNPFTLFDSQNRYSKSEKFTDISNNGAHALFNSLDTTVDLSVANQLNSTVVRESKVVFPYQPGKSLLIKNTFAFNSLSGNNLLQRVGYYSNYGNATYNAPYNPKNGIYLDASGSVISICKANNSNVTKVLQANWNNYTFSGEAPYFITLDLTKGQIFWIDIEWLGVGSVRTGFVINGQLIIGHTFHHANLETTTYMQTACLPIRYEIINTTNTGAGGTLKQICSTVMSEGGYENYSYVTHAGWENALYTISEPNSRIYIPLVSIRLKSGRFDSIVVPCQLAILLSTADNLQYKFILNGTLGGTGAINPVWKSPNTTSNVEYDISANRLTGGIELNSSYIYQNAALSLTSRNDFNLQLGKYFNGIVDNLPTYASDTLTVVTSLVKAGTSPYTISAMLGWYDIIK
jgi:hypothetical protein